MPMLTIPAASIDSVTPSETSGTKSANAAEPNIVRPPLSCFLLLLTHALTLKAHSAA